MADLTFPVYSADAIVNFFRVEVLTGQEAKQFSKSDLIPVPKPESIQTLYMRVLHMLYRFRPELHCMLFSFTLPHFLFKILTQTFQVGGTFSGASPLATHFLIDSPLHHRSYSATHAANSGVHSATLVFVPAGEFHEHIGLLLWIAVHYTCDV
ncbi:kinetochore protein Nuf2 [Notothenia coriiceps]|uniref:Kinetochore protein Nuf2 n=1 Tax=Notothenia coriiceps TaxID=8208 RepID=A0A6I9NNF4_9TELE|nr:PREDICTED: kinetochore protein Nuf2 [Notothenia coriiceps]